MKPSAPAPRARKSGGLLRRLGRLAAILLVGGYVLAVAGGYVFLRYGRNIDEVRLLDIALLRFTAIRHTLARQQFRHGQAAWEAKDFQQAYVYFSSAVLRDPDNLEGRLQAARFLAALGAVTLEVNLLEQGLLLAPASVELNEMLFTQLIAAGRHRRVLELLHGSHAAALTGPNAVFLLTVELQATLATAGAPAAKALLDQHPELRRDPKAALMVARVCWEAGAREEAVALMAAHVQAQPALLPPRLTLIGWQHELGQEQPAIDTAVAAARQFPGAPAPRALVFDVVARRIRGTDAWWREIAAYLKDFNASPESLRVLDELAGRRGWLEVTGSLYELAARRGDDLGLAGLFQADALGRNERYAEARDVLRQISQQSDDRGTGFLIQLRQREIAAAHALGDTEGVRESSRRLASLLRNDPDLIELYRGFYKKIGVAEAVVELSTRQPATARGAAAGPPEKPRGS